MKLTNGSKVAVIGGGPAGSFFTHFILEDAKKMGLKEGLFRNIMNPFFKTSKTSFLISPLYDTLGNSFSPLESKLLIAW